MFGDLFSFQVVKLAIAKLFQFSKEELDKIPANYWEKSQI